MLYYYYYIIMFNAIYCNGNHISYIYLRAPSPCNAICGCIYLITEALKYIIKLISIKGGVYCWQQAWYKLLTFNSTLYSVTNSYCRLYFCNQRFLAACNSTNRSNINLDNLVVCMHVPTLEYLLQYYWKTRDALNK